MSDAPYGSPFTAMREALCDQFGIDYEREYGCGSPDSPCSCVPLANAIDQAEREVAALRTQNEAMHDDLHEHDEKRHWAEVKVAELRELLTDARLALRRVYNASGQPSGMRPLLDKFDAALNPPHAQGTSEP